MNTPYNITPETAIAEWTSDLEQSWNTFVDLTGISKTSPAALEALKLVYRAGYADGSTFITKVMKHELNKQTNP